MRKFQLMAVLAAALVLMSISLKADDNCCPPNDYLLPCYDADYACESPDNGWTHETYTFNFQNEYVTDCCPVTIDYCVRDCNNSDNERKQVYICSVTYPDNCLSYYNPDDPQLKAERQSELWGILYGKITEKKFQEVYDNASAEEKELYRCPGVTGGGSFNNIRFNISYFRASCASYCTFY